MATAAPTISVIVPVYNAEEYLSECLDSILDQSYDALEILCINDGSRDNSAAILSEYEKEDARIKVITQENKGVCAARNAGLSTATGEYCLFVDSDDFIVPDTCKKLIETVQINDADIVVFGGKTFPTLHWADDCFAQRRATYIDDWSKALFSEAGSKPLMCNKLYKMSLIKENGLQFNPNLKLAEDHAFQFMVFPYSSCIEFIPDHLYYYRIRTGSAVSDHKDDHDKRIMLHKDAVEYVIQEWESLGFAKGNEKELYSWALNFLSNEFNKATFKSRVEFSHEFERFFDRRMGRYLENGGKLSAPLRNKLKLLTRAHCVCSEKPAFTFVLDSLDGSPKIHTCMQSVLSQDEQWIQVLILPPRISNHDLMAAIKEYEESDARVRLLPERSVQAIASNMRGDYMLTMPLNAVIREDAASTLVASANIIGKRQGVKGNTRNKKPQIMVLGDPASLLPTCDPYTTRNVTPLGGYEDDVIVSAEDLDGRLFDLYSLVAGRLVLSVPYLSTLLDYSNPGNLFTMTATALLSATKINLESRELIGYGRLDFASDHLAKSFVSSQLEELRFCKEFCKDAPAFERNETSFDSAVTAWALTTLRLTMNSNRFAQCYETATKYDVFAGTTGEGALADHLGDNDVALLEKCAKAESPEDIFSLFVNDSFDRIAGSLEQKAKLASNYFTNQVSLATQKDKLQKKVDGFKVSKSFRIGRFITYMPRQVKAIKRKHRKNPEQLPKMDVSAKIPGTGPKVSIVVPVYNVARFLPECLDGIINQTLKDIEIICVNDGSTDNSLEIIQSYAQRDPRIKVISKPNGGYGETMNRGVAAAKGEYVGIVESDDFADPRMFEVYYKYAKKHDLDIIKSNYFEHTQESDTFIDAFAGHPYYKVFDPAEKQGVFEVAPIIWSGLYRREMLVANGVGFNETPGASYQDTSFVFQAWAASRRAMLLPDGFLHYRVDNEGSSVKSSCKVFAVCDEYELSEAFLKAHGSWYEQFAPVLNRLRWGTYRWNYARIKPESHLAFAERMKEEFERAQAEGVLDANYFTDQDWYEIQFLLADVNAFCDKYKDEF